MVFRAESEPPGLAEAGGADGAPDERPGDAAVAFLRVGTGRNACPTGAGGVSAEGSEVEGSDDLLGIGDIYDDGGVGRGGDFFGIVEEHDEGAGHLVAVPDSPESGVAMYLAGIDEFGAA